jgi:hypothetical protein
MLQNGDGRVEGLGLRVGFTRSDWLIQLMRSEDERDW